MSNIKLFEHERFGQVRTLTDANGEPWFLAQEITRVLGYLNNAEAIRTNVDEDCFRQIYIPELSNNYTLINESGLYSLIMRSQKEEAKVFRKWVTSEVLPSIRKHGAYMTPDVIEKTLLNPDYLIQLATTLKESQEQNRKLNEKIAADADKVAFAESVNKTVDNLTVRDYAKVLYNENIKLGQNRLFHLLRMKGILDRDNKPYQKYIDNGWFVLKLSTYRNSSTDNIIEYTQPRITGKGQIALRTRILAWISGDEAVGE
ncbi:MAG: BRO family protein [Deferribacterales bacterium]